jgi:hypothetical protein
MLKRYSYLPKFGEEPFFNTFFADFENAAKSQKNEGSASLIG